MEFQKDIVAECEEVRMRVLAVWGKIERNICNKANKFGFLTGEVSHYIEVYDI